MSDLQKPSDKILSGICELFNAPLLFNGKFDDRDNIILTPYDLDINKDSSLYSFHIKPKNWSGDNSQLVNWYVSLTKTGKVKSKSLRQPSYK